jgi:branched-chain amino acid transport system ATP-binding protein
MSAEREPLLSCTNVTKTFGGVRALKQVTLHVGEGAVISLIGPNGAGKTSLFNCLSGFVEPDEGEVWFAGRRIDRRPAHAIARAGLVRTFQSIRMFEDLTVAESILAAQYARRHRTRGSRFKLIWKSTGAGDQLERVLELLGIEELRNKRCTDLPLLAQRKVEVARAVACEPSLLLLDEPSAGATAAESRELATVVERLRDGGTTVFVIEHNVPFVMSISDEIWVMNFGEIVAHGAPRTIRSNQLVRDIYLGA